MRLWGNKFLRPLLPLFSIAVVVYFIVCITYILVTPSLYSTQEKLMFGSDSTTLVNLSCTHGISYIKKKRSVFNKFTNGKDENEPIGPLLLHSAIYYNTSKFFPPNTALIQFRARYNISTSIRFLCLSMNETNIFVSEMKPEPAYLINNFCYFHTFFGLCKTVTDPTTIKLTIPQSLNDSVSLPIVLPSRENLGVVTCGSPIFFAEQWQQAAFTIEVLHFFGVARQIYYFISSSKHFYSLLKAYEELNFITIIPWVVPDIPKINSRQQLYMRDQMAAVNDCYQRYREAADFIIVQDMDDLIFLPQGRKYHSEFQSIYRNHPDAAFIHYGSYMSRLRTSKVASIFNLGKVLESAQISRIKHLGKSVVKPRRIKSIWVHYPQLFPAHLKPYEVPVKRGLVVHTRIWHFYKENNYKTSYFGFKGTNNYFESISDILSQEDIQNISSSWDMNYQSFKEKGLVKNLKSTNHYQPPIDICIKSIGWKETQVAACRTIYLCNIEAVKNFECIQMRQTWKRVSEALEAYLPIEEPRLEEKMNGCTLE